MTPTLLRFSGHQSFAFRNTWLTKGVNECAADPEIFRREDALVRLGVGKNMVDSIKHWCLATRLIEPRKEPRFAYQPTVIGRQLLVADNAWDPYLEDKGTLWLLHWFLATNRPLATTTYWAFNELTSIEFTRDRLYDEMINAIRAWPATVTAGTLRRDIGVFLRTYAGTQDRSVVSLEDRLDCPLAELGLVHQETEDVFSFVRGAHDSLPDGIFAYALCAYHQEHPQSTHTFDELAYFAGSPGRVFKLDEPALAQRLERLAESGSSKWQLTETAGLRQVVMADVTDPIEALKGYYAQSSS